MNQCLAWNRILIILLVAKRRWQWSSTIMSWWKKPSGMKSSARSKSRSLGYLGCAERVGVGFWSTFSASTFSVISKADVKTSDIAMAEGREVILKIRNVGAVTTRYKAIEGLTRCWCGSAS